MTQTVYRIYERPTDSPDGPGQETRVYLDKDLAVEHVGDNKNPEIHRWMETHDPDADPLIIDAE